MPRLRGGTLLATVLAAGGKAAAVENPLKMADSFTANNGTTVNGRTPDGASVAEQTWTVNLGTVTINGNAARPAAGTARMLYNVGLADGNIKVNLRTGESSSDHDFYQVVFRYKDAQNFWCVTIGKLNGGSVWKIYETVANSTTERASGSYTYAQNTNLALNVVFNGASITATFNGGTEISYTEAATLLTETIVGMVSRMDDVSVVNLQTYDDYQVYSL